MMNKKKLPLFFNFINIFIFKVIFFFANKIQKKEKLLKFFLEWIPFALRKRLENTSDICEIKEKIEFHTVLCHKDVSHGIICLHSFIRFFPRSIKLVIHEDGSLNKNDYLLIKKFLPNTKIIAFKSSQKVLLPYLKDTYTYIYKNRLRSLKRWHLLTIVDSWVFSQTRKVIYLDSDILFLKPPQRIIDWINSTDINTLLHCSGNPQNPYIHCFNSPEDFRHLYNINPINLFNMGILCFDKEKMKLQQINYFLSKIYLTESNDRNYRDQSFWCYYFSGLSSSEVERLPLEQYILPHAETKPIISEGAVSMHYISPLREHIYKNCFDYLLGKI